MPETFLLITAADEAQVVAIYNQAIATKGSTADLTPLTVAQRQPWFQEFSPDHFPLWVIETTAGIVGYVGLEPYSDRQAYA